jgi:hypothetical protein
MHDNNTNRNRSPLLITSFDSLIAPLPIYNRHAIKINFKVFLIYKREYILKFIVHDVRKRHSGGGEEERRRPKVEEASR